MATYHKNLPETNFGGRRGVKHGNTDESWKSDMAANKYSSSIETIDRALAAAYRCPKSNSGSHRWQPAESVYLNEDGTEFEGGDPSALRCIYCGLQIRAYKQGYGFAIERVQGVNHGIMGERMTEIYQKIWNQFPNGHGSPGDTIAYNIVLPSISDIDTQKLYTPPQGMEFVKKPFMVDRPGEHHIEQILRRPDGAVVKNRFYTLDDKLY